MKLFLILLVSASLAFAQNAFSDGKIDSHGGKFDSYGNTAGYKNNGFGKSISNDLSKYLNKKNESTDKNKSKTTVAPNTK
ncbi:hypothetical protein N9X61_02015 [Sulfurimonas sp.]|nr:hypothetical protein [Sulfurimonas sp.]